MDENCSSILPCAANMALSLRLMKHRDDLEAAHGLKQCMPSLRFCHSIYMLPYRGSNAACSCSAMRRWWSDFSMNGFTTKPAVGSVAALATAELMTWYLQGMLAVLAASTLWLGPVAMLKLYVLPYWINVVWLDVVTYLHHHGPSDASEKMPWYRGEVRHASAVAA